MWTDESTRDDYLGTNPLGYCYLTVLLESISVVLLGVASCLGKENSFEGRSNNAVLMEGGQAITIPQVYSWPLPAFCSSEAWPFEEGWTRVRLGSPWLGHCGFVSKGLGICCLRPQSENEAQTEALVNGPGSGRCACNWGFTMLGILRLCDSILT